MTREEEQIKLLEERLKVVKAFAEGKEVQWQYTGRGPWRDVSNPNWDWGAGQYRIKPQPRKVWVGLLTGADGVERPYNVHDSRPDLSGWLLVEGIRLAEFQEVIE